MKNHMKEMDVNGVLVNNRISSDVSVATACTAATGVTVDTTDNSAVVNTSTAPGQGNGFLSRMQSLRTSAAPILEVYGRAQKKAVQLKDQAVTEVERLKQLQELKQHDQENETQQQLTSSDKSDPKQKNGPQNQLQHNAAMIVEKFRSGGDATPSLESLPDAKSPVPTASKSLTEAAMDSSATPLPVSKFAITDLFSLGSNKTNDRSGDNPGTKAHVGQAETKESAGSETAEVATATLGDVSTPISDQDSRKTYPESNRSAPQSPPQHLQISSPLLNAFNIVRQTSREVAKDFIRPSAVSHSHSKGGDVASLKRSSSNSSEEEDLSISPEEMKLESDVKYDDAERTGIANETTRQDVAKKANKDVSDNSSNNAIGGTKLTAAASAVANAYAEFRTVGRYRMMKDNEPPQNVATSYNPKDSHPTAFGEMDEDSLPPFYACSPMVGGAERVGGLRHLNLGEMINKVNRTNGTDADLKIKEDKSVTSAESGKHHDGDTVISSTSVPDRVSIGGSKQDSVTSTITNTSTPTRKDKTNSRTSYYEDAVRSILQPGQRALFFGKGTLGVVLKPSFLACWRGKEGGGLLSPAVTTSVSGKRGGVFVDYLVPGGHAEKSGVVYVGDHILKVGTLDVSNMTLDEVVKAIGDAKRPNIMVLSSEHEVDVVSLSEDEGDISENMSSPRRYFGSPIDLSLGFVNKVAAEGVSKVAEEGLLSGASCSKLLSDIQNECQPGPKGHPMKEVMSQTSLLDEDEDDDAESDVSEEVLFSGEEDYDGTHAPGINTGEPTSNHSPSSEPYSAFAQTSKAYSNMSKATILSTTRRSQDIQVVQFDPPPPLSIIKPELFGNLVMYASHRTNGHHEHEHTPKQKTQIVRATVNARSSNLPALLERAALLNSGFRSALSSAFSECCVDPRRRIFLENYYRVFKSKKEVQNEKVKNRKKRHTLDRVENDVASSSLQRVLLELYIELCKFRDVVSVCSISGREKLLDYARAISARFLSVDDFDANNDSLPEHVAHIALGGTEAVLSVKRALRDEDEFFESEDGDGFCTIRSSLESFMSIQEAFLSFLISDECARMRAYLRGTAPFLNVNPRSIFRPKDGDYAAHNFLSHAILHLTCMRERSEQQEQDACMSDAADEDTLRDDAVVDNHGERKIGAVSMLSCANFILYSLEKDVKNAMEGLIEDGMTGKIDNVPSYLRLINSFEFLWEAFVAPGGGTLDGLSLSRGTQETLDALRRLIVAAVDGALAKVKSTSANHAVSMARVLTTSEICISLHNLGEALLHEYTLNLYPRFRRHIFYEWACKEVKAASVNTIVPSHPLNQYFVVGTLNGFATGWMNRFLRQIELPRGLSLHRPGSHSPVIDSTEVSPLATKKSLSLHGADVALVFGTHSGAENASFLSDASNDSHTSYNVKRFSCVPLHSERNPSYHVLLPDDIPTVFEKYALAPPFCERPFQGMLQDEKNFRISSDGWEVSLTNFAIPSGPSSSGLIDGEWLYCVSLIFHKDISSNVDKSLDPFSVNRSRKFISEREINAEYVNEFTHLKTFDEAYGVQIHHDGGRQRGPLGPNGQFDHFKSPISTVQSEGRTVRKVNVSASLPGLNRSLDERRRSQLALRDSGMTIGIALVSGRNVIPCMRETLSLLYNDYCSALFQSEGYTDGKKRFICQPLVDILGILSLSKVEGSSLNCILEPYINFTTSKWIDRPLFDQKAAFTETSGTQLMQSLPPVPLALLFVTILLERKVIFSSSRRGLLMSASHAIMQLLRPLRWPHLLVPLVPSSMMNDLMHYPAPFILGIPTDVRESAEILSSLPPDVTLVDLDIGRVILASSFSNDDSLAGSDREPSEAAGALRSQVLFLAESLGGVFGSAAYRNSWCSESPLLEPSSSVPDFFTVQSVCEDFIGELLSGVYSCCLWVEEKNDKGITGKESSIIFDEDRFYHIKALRAEGRLTSLFMGNMSLGSTSKCGDLSKNGNFSLSLDHFDLVLETFLRSQCLSTYISSGKKESMLFW